MVRNTIEYKLTWNILIDVFRELKETFYFDNPDPWDGAMGLIDDIDTEILADLTVENTEENIQNYPPIDQLFLMNPRAVSRAASDFRNNEYFKKFIKGRDEIRDEEKIQSSRILKIHKLAEEIFEKDLYIKDVPVLPQKLFTEEHILKYVDLYKNGKVPLFYEFKEYEYDDPDEYYFNSDEYSEGPPEDNNKEPLNNKRLPLYPTGKDFLPPNIFSEPFNLNKQLKERLQQNKFTEYGKADNIDVPYLIGVDNVQRLYNNNKMQAQLRNGTANNRDRIKQWHIDKTIYKLDKYGLYKQPIQIKSPFNK